MKRVYNSKQAQWHICTRASAELMFLPPFVGAFARNSITQMKNDE
jgi:hypothetical protein